MGFGVWRCSLNHFGPASSQPLVCTKAPQWQSHTHTVSPRRCPKRTITFTCNFFLVSVWEYVEKSIFFSFLASGETRRQASIAEFAYSCSQRGPVASKQYPIQSECRVGISQLWQKKGRNGNILSRWLSGILHLSLEYICSNLQLPVTAVLCPPCILKAHACTNLYSVTADIQYI